MLHNLFAFVAATAALARAQVVPPSLDPWYQQPSNITAYAPGELIRQRELSSRIQPLIPIPADASVERIYQYLYRTTDSLGDAVAAVTTLLVPYNSDPTKLLVYQTAYDSSNPDCSPSYSLQYGSAPGGLLGVLGANSTLSTDGPFIAAALQQGWWVTTADYEGLEAQYTAGLQAGYATLDSIRVVLNEGPAVGLSRQAKYAMWGYSGGALANGWAVELQPSYAPELRIEGAALGGTVPSVANTLKTINRGPFAGLAFSGINGLSKAYPNFTGWLDQNLVPSKREQFFDIATSCLTGAGTQGIFQDVYSYFINGQNSLNEAVPASIVGRETTLGLRDTPLTPLYIYKAVGDEVSPVGDTDALVAKYCAQGGTIEYHRDLVGEHVTEAIFGSANAFGWVADRLRGEPVSTRGRCVTNNVIVSAINPNTAALLGAEVVAALKLLLGGELGESF